MEFTPLCKTVVCELVSDGKSETTVNGITYATTSLPVYVVKWTSPDVTFCATGDHVFSCSTGDKIKFDDTYIYVFKAENIMAKVK